MSFKDYCKNITSNISIFSESWGWFVDLEQNNNITNNKNTNTNNNNKFIFYKNKIEIYKDKCKQIIHNINNRTSTINNTRTNISNIRSRQSISSKLSELEMQFDMDDDYEKEIVGNNIYTKLIHGICFITILLLIIS
jgi:hypothetical protein